MSVEIISTTLVPATASAPAGPYDLTTLAIFHDEINLPTSDTGNDPFISRAITQASQLISKYCNRIFQVETVQDQIFIYQDAYPFQTPGGVDPLQLSRFPLVNSGVITFTGNTYGTTLIDTIPSTAGMVVGMPVFAIDGSIPAGALIQTVNPNSVVLTLAATTSVVGQSLNTGLQVIQTLAVGETQTLVYGGDFTVKPTTGWLLRLNPYVGITQRWEAEPVTVIYQAGYATIPADLQQACLRLVTARYYARGRDPMLMQQDQPGSTGMQRWWIGTQPDQQGSLPPEIEAICDQYRVPPLA